VVGQENPGKDRPLSFNGTQAFFPSVAALQSGDPLGRR